MKVTMIYDFCETPEEETQLDENLKVVNKE